MGFRWWESIDHGLALRYAHIGASVHRNTCFYISFAVIVMLLCSAGVVNININTEAESSYIQSNKENNMTSSYENIRGGKEAATRPIHLSRQALPNRDTQLLESPAVWIKDKQEVDADRFNIPESLWCIHGKLYNLEKYLDKHPGGADWLHFVRGSDCTDAFETHHIDIKKAEIILAKYYVEDATINPKYKGEELRRYTFEKDGLFCVLRRRAHEVLGSSAKNRRPTLKMHLTATFLLSSFLALVYAAAVYNSVLSALLAGVFLHGLMGVGHNFFHQPDNLWMYAFDLSLFTSHNWRVSHAISHHIYANLELDTEVSSLEPFMYFLSNKPKNGFYINVVYHVMSFIGSLLDWVRHWAQCLLGREKPRPENVLPFLQLALLAYYQGFARGFLLFACVQGMASYLLLTLSFAVHRTEHAWTEGDELKSMDFAHHIVNATHDHSHGLALPLSMLFFAGLNNHTLHHLFPTVDASHLYELEPMLRKTLDEFGYPPLKFHSFPYLYLSALRRHDLFVPKLNKE